MHRNIELLRGSLFALCNVCTTFKFIVIMKFLVILERRTHQNSITFGVSADDNCAGNVHEQVRPVTPSNCQARVKRDRVCVVWRFVTAVHDRCAVLIGESFHAIHHSLSSTAICAIGIFFILYLGSLVTSTRAQKFRRGCF